MPPKTQSAASVRHLFNSPEQSPRPPDLRTSTPPPQWEPLEEQQLSNDEKRLNKTERRWLEILRERGHVVKIHKIKLKLADNTHYTAEFLVREPTRIVIWEVKGGYIREDAWIKLKVAAAQFPEFTFKMAQWADDRRWIEKEVQP